MRRSKHYVDGFINHLFGVYNVPRIPIYVHWHNDVIATESGSGFGVYISNNDGTGKEIHVAALKTKTTGTLFCLAHEFVHYMQDLHGRTLDEQSEQDAEYWANALYNQYRINKKDKRRRVEGIARIWEHMPTIEN